MLPHRQLSDVIWKLSKLIGSGEVISKVDYGLFVTTCANSPLNPSETIA
jgi:hypothetical protein